MPITLLCPHCNKPIVGADVNISTDLAKCGNCGSIHKASALLALQEEAIVATPPQGSKIEVLQGAGGVVKLHFPRRGFTKGDFPYLFLFVVWCVFLVYWVWGAAQKDVFFALLSFPMWLLTGVMLNGFMNAAIEKQTVTIDKTQLIIEKHRIVNSRSVVYKLAEIDEIKLTHLKAGLLATFSNPRYIWWLQWSFGAGIFMPSVIKEGRVEYFFEYAKAAEQEWMVKYLNKQWRETRG